MHRLFAPLVLAAGCLALGGCEREPPVIKVKQAAADAPPVDDDSPIEPDAAPSGGSGSGQKGTVHEGVLGPAPQPIFDNVKTRMKRAEDEQRRRMKEQGVD